MVDSLEATQTLEEMTTKFTLEVPVNMRKIRCQSLASGGGSPSDYESRFTEYILPDKICNTWLPVVAVGFRGPIEQHYSLEKYAELLAKRQAGVPAYGRISIELTPLLTDLQVDGVSSSFSIDGLTRTISLDVPVHLIEEQERSILAEGNRSHSDRYFAQFLVHDSYQRLMPSDVKGALPSWTNLFVLKDQYSKLVEKRKQQDRAYGRIVITLEPLVKQGCK